MPKVRELRAIIYENFDSESKCADAMGWKRQKLNKITNGIVEPDINDLNDLSKTLNKPIEFLAHIFLRYKSPNEQQNQTKSA